MQQISTKMKEIMDESIYYGGHTRIEFSDPIWDKDGKPFYPFGGAMCMRHSREEPELWHTYRYSAIPSYGWKLIGSDLSMTKAIQLAREMQG
jgi:hypothetical protein